MPQLLWIPIIGRSNCFYVFNFIIREFIAPHLYFTYAKVIPNRNRKKCWEQNISRLIFTYSISEGLTSHIKGWPKLAARSIPHQFLIANIEKSCSLFLSFLFVSTWWFNINMGSSLILHYIFLTFFISLMFFCETVSARNSLSTHIVDISEGKAVPDVNIELYSFDTPASSWQLIKQA